MGSGKKRTQSHKKYSKISLKVNLVLLFRSVKPSLSQLSIRLTLSPKFPKNLTSNSPQQSLFYVIIARMASFSTKIWGLGAEFRKNLKIRVNLNAKFQLLQLIRRSESKKYMTKMVRKSPMPPKFNRLSINVSSLSSAITLAFPTIIYFQTSIDFLKNLFFNKIQIQHSKGIDRVMKSVCLTAFLLRYFHHACSGFFLVLMWKNYQTGL